MHPIDAMDEEHAAALDAAMTAVSKHDDEAARIRLFTSLLTATVAVAAHDPQPAAGPRTVQAGDQLAFVTLRGEDGGVLLPVFTRMSALSGWTAGRVQSYFTMPLARVFEMASQDGATTIWINPGEPISGYVTPHEIRDLARGRIPLGHTARVATQRQTSLSPFPSPPPPQLLDTVTVPLARRPEIDRAWGFHSRQDGLEAETVIGVGFVPGTAHEAVRAAMRAIVAEACEAAEVNKEILFMAVGDDLRNALANGAGFELYRAGDGA